MPSVFRAATRPIGCESLTAGELERQRALLRVPRPAGSSFYLRRTLCRPRPRRLRQFQGKSSVGSGTLASRGPTLTRRALSDCPAPVGYAQAAIISGVTEIGHSLLQTHRAGYKHCAAQRVLSSFVSDLPTATAGRHSVCEVNRAEVTVRRARAAINSGVTGLPTDRITNP